MTDGAAPAEGRDGSLKASREIEGVGGLSSEEWSTFKRRGRDILRRARDSKGCLRRMRSKADAFFKLHPVDAESREGSGRNYAHGAGAKIKAKDLSRKPQITVSYGGREGAVSCRLISFSISDVDGILGG